MNACSGMPHTQAALCASRLPSACIARMLIHLNLVSSPFSNAPEHMALPRSTDGAAANGWPDGDTKSARLRHGATLGSLRRYAKCGGRGGGDGCARSVCLPAAAVAVAVAAPIYAARRSNGEGRRYWPNPAGCPTHTRPHTRHTHRLGRCLRRGASPVRYRLGLRGTCAVCLSVCMHAHVHTHIQMGTATLSPSCPPTTHPSPHTHTTRTTNINRPTSLRRWSGGRTRKSGRWTWSSDTSTTSSA